MVKINGVEMNIQGKTVSQYLAENGYDGKRVAVELNGDILPKSQYEITVLQDNDCVEIVCFVGGG
ncbi:MAG: sulfur carrier protein ThiS [Ruminococcus sp.]|nr:sulfur carrier protein ThiS [Ruminococcus sp.]